MIEEGILAWNSEKFTVWPASWVSPALWDSVPWPLPAATPPPDNGFFHALRMGWPDGITPESKSMGNFWVWTWVTAWIIGIIMRALMFVVIFRDSAKRAKKAGKGEFPRQTAYNVNLELTLTTVPVLIVMALFFFTVQTQDEVTALDKNPEVTVNVTAYQWNWKFGYGEVKSNLAPGGSDYDGTDQQKADDSALLSAPSEEVDEHKPAGPIHGGSSEDYSYLNYDKIETVGTSEEVPVLVLPSNTPIEFNLASSDVIHSFWVPEFLFKRDAMPHPEKNHQERRFQIAAIEEEGAFVGRCARDVRYLPRDDELRDPRRLPGGLHRVPRLPPVEPERHKR